MHRHHRYRARLPPVNRARYWHELSRERRWPHSLGIAAFWRRHHEWRLIILRVIQLRCWCIQRGRTGWLTEPLVSHRGNFCWFHRFGFIFLNAHPSESCNIVILTHRVNAQSNLFKFLLKLLNIHREIGSLLLIVNMIQAAPRFSFLPLPLLPQYPL